MVLFVSLGNFLNVTVASSELCPPSLYVSFYLLFSLTLSLVLPFPHSLVSLSLFYSPSPIYTLFIFWYAQITFLWLLCKPHFLKYLSLK